METWKCKRGIKLTFDSMQHHAASSKADFEDSICANSDAVLRWPAVSFRCACPVSRVWGWGQGRAARELWRIAKSRGPACRFELQTARMSMHVPLKTLRPNMFSRSLNLCRSAARASSMPQGQIYVSHSEPSTASVCRGSGFRPVSLDPPTQSAVQNFSRRFREPSSGMKCMRSRRAFSANCTCNG